MSKFLDQEGLKVLWEKIVGKVDTVVNRGYYFNDEFYTDSTYTTKIIPVEHALYIDSNNDLIYTYNGAQYISTNDVLPEASSDLEGVMKLYAEKGLNTDGTMTQKAITDNLNQKVEIAVDQDEELVIFSITQ